MTRIVAPMIAAVLLAACGGEEPQNQVSPQPTTPAETASPSPEATGDAVELELEAEDVRFEEDTLKAPAGAGIVMKFKNRDGQIPHNFALYESKGGTAIFQGEVDTGSQTYEFAAPDEPGKYYFQCDVHPDRMNGTFTAT